MRLLKFGINIFILFLCVSITSAYDKLTHSKITKEAYNASVPKSGYLNSIGISEEDTFDTSNITIKIIDPETGKAINDGTPLGWLREGSILEDEYTIIPWLMRFQNHFYNPLDGSGLDFTTLGVRVTGYPAPNWGLEDVPAYPEQLFSIKDAREYLYKGLTATTKAEREKNIALTFRTLGHVVHLIEDMAQPQHTRNDPHGGFLGKDWGPQILGQKSRYEAYVEDDKNRNKFTYSGYSVVIFDEYRSYFETTDGKGISQFSNRNFVTHGTNFTKLEPGNYAPGFPEPELDLNRKTEIDIQQLIPGQADIWGNLLTGMVTFFGNSITDNYTKTSFTNDRMTTYSLFDYDLRKKGKDPTFTLNDFNFKSAGDILLRRAVGYSTGLLNYFFRNPLKVKAYWDGEGVYIEVRNTGQEKMEGQFELYARYDKGKPDETREKLASLNAGATTKISANSSKTFSITIPLNYTTTPYYLLVFRGKLGTEQDAVVGLAFDVPHVIVIQNGYHADISSDCNRRDWPVSFPRFRGATGGIEYAELRCEWRSENHSTSGKILTNMPEPIIERIEARWYSGISGPAPLEIDGIQYGGIWQRQGTEPDPVDFQIIDPAYRDNGVLYLNIYLKRGEWIATSLATFNRSVSAHSKGITLDDPEPYKMRYLVSSSRVISPTISYNWYTKDIMNYPSFDAISVSGHTNPTDTVTYRQFGKTRLGEGILVTPFMYNEAIIDDFEIFPSSAANPSKSDPAYGNAKAFFDTIEPLVDPQTHEGPFIQWEATVKRVYQPMELEFLRAFMIADPPQFTISLSGTQQ